MTGLDIFGHIGYVLIGGGMILLSRKNILGWVCRFIGEAMWIYIGWEVGLTSIWFWGIVFVIIDAVGFFSWRKKSATHSIHDCSHDNSCDT